MYACLFDIDGTLIDTGGAGRAAMYAGFQAEFAVAKVSDGVPFTGRTDRAIAADLLGRHGFAASDDHVQRCLAAYLAHLPESLHRHRHGRVLPGIQQLLELLRARADVATGLLTGNIRAGARTKLAHYRLFECFAFGAYGDDHWDRDDVARAAVGTMAAHLGRSLAPHRVCVIGDTPLDVQCARAIGARAVAVQTGWSSPEELHASKPDLLLDDLADPTPLLDMLR
jgi:phosphoglycolate phosphatase-like HAD superfamily hydrolase